MKIDFTYVSIHYEIWALREHFDTMERQLPSIAKRERQQLEQKWKSVKSEDEMDDLILDYQELTDLTENVVPRYLRMSIIVALWAIYEAATIEIANNLKEKHNHVLKLGDIRGKHKLDSTRKYFEHVLNLPLTTDEGTYNELRKLMTLRNAIAHGNGRRDAIKQDVWQQIEGLPDFRKEIVVANGYLEFKPAMIYRLLGMVEASLKDLIKRARKHT